MRWWSHIKDDGEEEWIFESLPEPEAKAHAVDATIFWGASYGSPIIWLILAIVSLVNLSLNSVTICVIGTALGAVNLLGYVKCQKNHKMALKSFLVKISKDNISQEQINKFGKMAAEQAIKANLS